MKTILSRALCVVLLLCLCAPCIAVSTSAAANVSVALGLSATSVYVGSTVRVTVTYTSTEPIGSWSFSLFYDTGRLQYLSGADSNPSAGKLNFSNYAASGGQSRVSYTVSFRTTALGSATVYSSTNQIVITDYSIPNVADKTRNISIIEKPAASTENNLSALTVEGYTLSPPFSAAVTVYALTVPYTVTALDISASAASGAARTAVAGADALQVGDNTVQVTVTAESGDTKTYTLTVTREDSPYAAASVALDGKTLDFPRDPAETAAPAGYVPEETTYDGKSVLGFRNESGSVHIVVLTELVASETAPDGEKHYHIYLYDAAAQRFLPYIELAPALSSWVVLEKPADVALPEGFEEATLLLSETPVTAYQSMHMQSRYYLIWASPVAGSAAFYLYDSADGSVQAYAPQVLPEGEKTREELKEELSEAQARYEKLFDITRYITLGGGGVIVALVLFLIISAVVRRGKARREKRRRAAQEALLPQLPPQSAAQIPVQSAPQIPVQSVPPDNSDFVPPPAPAISFIPQPPPQAPSPPAPHPPSQPPLQAPSPPPIEEVPELKQVFGAAPDADADALFAKNNPLVEEDADEDEPVYGFEDEE